MHADAGCEFWADAPSYADVDLSAVRGYRQVTDAYLVGLAAGRSSVLVTLDEPLARRYPNLTALIPDEVAEGPPPD